MFAEEEGCWQETTEHDASAESPRAWLAREMDGRADGDDEGLSGWSLSHGAADSLSAWAGEPLAAEDQVH